jgi:hypothetical protein
MARCLTALVVTGLVVLLGSAFAAATPAGDGPAEAKAAKKKKKRTYKGETSQGEPVSMKTSRAGLKFTLGWSAAACDDGGKAFTGTTFNSNPLETQKGNFHVSTTFSDAAADGVQVAYTVELSGRAKRKKASGSWRITAAGPDTKGGRWSCDTNAVEWSAKAKRKGGKSASRVQLRDQGGLGLQTNTSSPGRRPAPPPPTSLSGQVRFAERNCYGGSAFREAPLANARILFSPTTADPVEAQLDSQGRFENVQVPASPQIYAFAITDGPRVTVAPDVDGAQPYLLGLGEVNASNQVFDIGSVGNTPPTMAQGAANIYGTLDEGARVAAAASPVSIPKVRARWRYGLGGNWLGDRAGSAYDSSNNTIHVGGRLAPPTGDISGGTPDGIASARDEYEKLPLLHEYGHHVLEQVAAPPASAGGDHDFSSVHPDNPGLPWSEGFAHAFAAMVTGNAQQTLGCTTRLNLGAEPATARFSPSDPLAPMPEAANSHRAQYNETAIAGGLFHIARFLGGGNPRAGLAPLLGALHASPPESMRDARDALAEDPSIESTPEDHEVIAEFLRKQRISWAVTVIASGDRDSVNGQPETQVRMQGAYGCQVTDEFADDSGLLPEDRGGGFFELGGEGGLSHTWHDDCFGFSDGDPTTLSPGGPDFWFVDFPYSGSSDPDGDDLTLSVRYTCHVDGTPDTCASTFNSSLRYYLGADPSSPSAAARFHQVSAPLTRNVWTPILQFDGMGHCTSVLDGFDCSI